MKKFLFGLALAASLFCAFTGCENIAKSDKEYTVTFDVNGDRTTVKVDPDIGIIMGWERPDVDIDNNRLLYWSESKASQDTAQKYDFDDTVEKNITLYAILTPELDGIEEFDSENKQVKIRLSGSNVYPLEDGSYAGLKLYHSSDMENWEDCNINIPSSFEDVNDQRYLTYTITSPLNDGVNFFKVSNTFQEYILTDGLTPAPAASLITEVNDSYAKLSFTTARFWTKYTVKVYEGTSVVASRSVTSKLAPTTKSEEFYGLKNNTEYTFKVFTDDTDQFAETRATPEIVKKESDWVIAMYMDGDNNLHEDIWIDISEAEYGLYKIRSGDEPLTGYDSVNVVALWDGAVGWKNSSGKYTTPRIGESGTYLLELGPDSDAITTYTTSHGCNLSQKTKNLSYTADWVNNNAVSITNSAADVHGEVNMGDKETLVNYLNWVNAHYKANKGIILQFSDHGGGPRSVQYVQTKDGRTIKVGDTDGRRALCWDESTSSSFLKTKDVSYALNEAGFGTDNKLSMIIMDVCLGSSIEDAYEFKDYAKYLAASPNNIPASGLNYTNFIQLFSSDRSLDDIALIIVESYYSQYQNSSDWDYYAQQFCNSNSMTYNKLTSAQKEAIEWAGDLGITTFTVTDLSKVDDVKNAINSLCEVLLSDEGNSKTLYVDENGVFTSSVSENTTKYVTYLGQHHANVVNYFTNENYYYINDSIYYKGTYTWLYDLGYLADMMRVISGDTYSGGSNANAWPALNAAATAVSEKLSEAIKYSWRDSRGHLYFSSRQRKYVYDFYNNIDKGQDYKHHYGLTISGANIATNGSSLKQGSAPDYYKTDLAFGKDTAWGDLLEYWFGTGN